MSSKTKLDYSVEEILYSEGVYVGKLGELVQFLTANNNGDSSESILVNKLRRMTQPTRDVHHYHQNHG